MALRRVDKAEHGLRPGDFLVASGQEATLEAIAKQTGVDFKPLPAAITTGTHEMKRRRVAMYQRFGGGYGRGYGDGPVALHLYELTSP